MKCSHCSAEVPEGMAFCPACGAPTAAEASRSAAEKPRLRQVPVSVFAVLVVGALLVGGGVGAGIHLLTSAPASNQADATQGTNDDALDATDDQEADPNKDAASTDAGEASGGDEEAATSDGAAAEEPAFDPVADAQARGLLVTTGTIMVFENDADVCAYQGISNPNPGYSGGPHAVFFFDSPVTINGLNGDGMGYSDNATSGIELATDEGADAWRSYSGMHVTAGISSSGYWWRSDVSVPMDTARLGDGTFEVLQEG